LVGWIGATWWLPRQVEAHLEAALRARGFPDADLGVTGIDLGGVDLEAIELSREARAAWARIEGAPWQLLGGRARALRTGGVEVALGVPAPGQGGAVPAEQDLALGALGGGGGGDLGVREVSVRDARVHLRCGARSVDLSLAGRAVLAGGAVQVEVAGRAGGIPLSASGARRAGGAIEVAARAQVAGVDVVIEARRDGEDGGWSIDARGGGRGLAATVEARRPAGADRWSVRA